MLMTRNEFVFGSAAFAGFAAIGVPMDGHLAQVEGTLFNIWKFATKDGPGIRTVVALKGCPLRCVWCHSPESWSYSIEKYSNGETVGWKTTAEKVVEEVLRDKPFYDASGGGLTLTGGEPLAQANFCREILRLAKAAGLNTAIETSGYAPLKVIEDVRKPLPVACGEGRHEAGQTAGGTVVRKGGEERHPGVVRRLEGGD